MSTATAVDPYATTAAPAVEKNAASTRERLLEIGVSDALLSADEIAFLDQNGYLPLPGIITQTHVNAINSILEYLAEVEGENAGKEVHQEAGTTRLANLIDKNPVFDICFSHPKVLAAVHHVLGPNFHISSLNARAAHPGAGLQGLHMDGPIARGVGDYIVCNSLWMLDDFTPFNGATRLVPGSHNFFKTPGEMMKNPSDPHPDQVLAQGKAGTVVVFNSHTWHGGTLNTTDKPRRAMHGYWSRRDSGQQLDQRKHLSPATVMRLNPVMRHLLDVE